MIHVCFALYDKTGHFAKFVGTAMLSLFENAVTPPHSIAVHILHDNTLTNDSRDKFMYIAGRYEQIVKFYNVEELCTNRIKKIKELLPRAVQTRFTIAMYYRFFIPDVLPPNIDKIIYLDADIIVNLDINELWQFDLGEKVLGVVTKSSQELLDAPNKGSFNSGVMLINVPVFRSAEENINNAIEFMSEHPEYGGNDQSILNYCFAKEVLHLPVKFNRLVKFNRGYHRLLDRGYKDTQVKNMIYHFNAHNSVRGLGTDMSDPYNRLWMSYFIRTPFFDADSIGRLCELFRKIHNKLRTGNLKFYNALLGKTRTFFIEPTEIDAIKKIFSIRDDELIIPAENEDSLKKLFAEMKNSKGKTVFFIMTEIFLEKKFPFDQLKKEGFINGKDFFNGRIFLSEENGGSINSNPYIQVL